MVRLERQASNQGPDSMSFQSSTYELIERDVEIPEEFFSTDYDPPIGYVMKNTKSTAEWSRFGSGGFGDGRFRVNVLFTLPNGSLIVGWKNTQRGNENDQAALFEGLTVGGPLPKLPWSITGITSLGIVDKEVQYWGRHLTTTQIDGQYYAWSLFVPERAVPPPEQFFGYMFSYGKGTPPDEKLRSTDTRGSFAIKSDDEFNHFVRGAMAEYSDDATAPAHVTAEGVRQLEENIRRRVP